MPGVDDDDEFPKQTVEECGGKQGNCTYTKNLQLQQPVTEIQGSTI